MPLPSMGIGHGAAPTRWVGALCFLVGSCASRGCCCYCSVLPSLSLLVMPFHTMLFCCCWSVMLLCGVFITCCNFYVEFLIFKRHPRYHDLNWGADGTSTFSVPRLPSVMGTTQHSIIMRISYILVCNAIFAIFSVQIGSRIPYWQFVFMTSSSKYSYLIFDTMKRFMTAINYTC